jgi:hypothetical protein
VLAPAGRHHPAIQREQLPSLLERRRPATTAVDTRLIIPAHVPSTRVLSRCESRVDGGRNAASPGGNSVCSAAAACFSMWAHPDPATPLPAASPPWHAPRCVASTLIACRRCAPQHPRRVATSHPIEVAVLNAADQHRRRVRGGDGCAGEHAATQRFSRSQQHHQIDMPCNSALTPVKPTVLRSTTCVTAPCPPHVPAPQLPSIT